jgi:membrane-associated phospholipid phosphatase
MRTKARVYVALCLALSAALFAGCSGLAPHAPPAQSTVADLPWPAPATETAEASPAGPTLEQPSLEYRLGRIAPGAGSGLSLENRPGFQWVSTITDGSSSPPASTEAPTQSPFSWEYWKLAGRDIVATVTAPAHWGARDWLVFGGVAAGIGTVAVFDHDIQRAVQRNRNGTLDSVANAVQPFGNEYAPAVLGAFYAGGELFKDSRLNAVAMDGAAASIIASGLILQPLKYGIGRSRPGANAGAYNFHPFNGADSFPSGHTTEAFVLATVIAEHYDSICIKAAAYTVASAVGWARLNNNAHWASDVLAGAALGTFVSHVVVHYNLSQRRISLAPLVGPGLQGAQFTYSF